MSETQNTAFGLWEFSTVPSGIDCADAIAKGAPVAHLMTGTVHPGKYIVIVTGDPASVEVANDIVHATPRPSLLDSLYLADISRDVAASLFDPGASVGIPGDAVAVVETSTFASGIRAADAALKYARVSLASLRIADGLGGKALFIVDGEIGEVQAAVEAAVDSVGALIQDSVVIAQLAPELRADLEAGSRLRKVLTAHGGSE